jgi:ssDNA-binding Zn-finger/Zn-ribbon topoisomerase 1
MPRKGRKQKMEQNQKTKGSCSECGHRMKRYSAKNMHESTFYYCPKGEMCGVAQIVPIQK